MLVLKVEVISLPYIFQVLYVLCFTRPRYQVSVYRTIGPLVGNAMAYIPPRRLRAMMLRVQVQQQQQGASALAALRQKKQRYSI